jgi:serine/threonine-protein kinase
MGSPHYMSPEQMISSKDVDTRSDVWAVGVILFQLLTARVPFDAETLGGLMSRVLTEGPPSLAAARPEVPQPICEVVAWCLQKNRDQRAPNVAAVATALAPFAHPRSLPIADRIATLLGAAPLDLAAMSPRANSAPPAAAPPLGGSQPGARGSVPSGPEPSLDGSQPNVAAPPSFAASQPALSRSQVTSVSPPPRKGGPLLAVAVGGVVLLAAGAFGIRQWRASRAPVAAADSTAPTTTAPAVTAPIVVPGVVAGATASAAATAPATATIAATTSATATPEPSTAVAVTTKKGGPARTAVAPPPGPPPTPPPPPVPTVRKSVLDDRN